MCQIAVKNAHREKIIAGPACGDACCVALLATTRPRTGTAMDETRKILMASAAHLPGAEPRSPARSGVAKSAVPVNCGRKRKRYARPRRKRSRTCSYDGGDDGDDDGDISALQSAFVVKPRGACVLLQCG